MHGTPIGLLLPAILKRDPRLTPGIRLPVRVLLRTDVNARILDNEGAITSLTFIYVIAPDSSRKRDGHALLSLEFSFEASSEALIHSVTLGMRTNRTYRVTVNFKLFGLCGREVLVLQSDEARGARNDGFRMVWEACVNFSGLKILSTTSELLPSGTTEITPSDRFEWERAWGRRLAKSRASK